MFNKKKKMAEETVQATMTEETVQSVEVTFDDRIADILLLSESIAKITKTIANELKTLKKEHQKITKKMTMKKKKSSDAPKKKSGFAPTKISAELAAFLGIPEDELISRPNVTKGINVYINEHNLKRESDKRYIDLTKPNGEVLANLLGISRDEELTIFKMQKFLKDHFPKKVVDVVDAVNVVDAVDVVEGNEKVEETVKESEVSVKSRRRRGGVTVE